MTNSVIKTLVINGINPISTNKLYIRTKNRVVKHPQYQKYRETLCKLLPDKWLPTDMSKHSLVFQVGIVESFDLDNTLKGIIDALQEKYSFNDSQIRFFVAQKTVIDPDKEQRFIKIHLIDKLVFNTKNAEVIDLSKSDLISELNEIKLAITK